ncbi:sulfite exporter TauE/SafE family protein [Alkalicoccobacillus murimartini]|uniref:Probable membrane transporter protein n=1 Tax=Alkalicoccobacillus murimartini TaxID=171685 RepID=A0ABT9YKE6_9BACI|nr:sulfite exporter TauE/SafE family protein [Alkalicoccobacillus murimartini]MDQ0207687.1 putative membrane protein YfcA [Alkalicoccobacillus murimartini]
MIIILTMFLLGILLGFIGAGGAGFVIALLTVAFGFPIHTALGTSLAAMAFTTLSGAYSHYREKNIVVKMGLIVGISAFFSSFAGAKLAVLIREDTLHYFTAAMLILSAVCMLFKLMISKDTTDIKMKKNQVWIRGIGLGLLTGLLAGMFGVGSAPFIQLGLLIFLHLSLRQSVGTTMLVILPISIGGGLGYVTEGFVDWMLLLKVLIGTMTGAYIGAKFTNLAPKIVLKIAVIATPAVAGLLLLL